jgi:hypothetical protein
MLGEVRHEPNAFADQHGVDAHETVESPLRVDAARRAL